MSQEGVESFLGRLITDTHFRESATASLEEACRRHGLPITASEARYLKALDLSRFTSIAKIVNGAIRRN